MTITYLEMLSPLEVRPKRLADDRFWIGQAILPQWQFNRFLYHAVGAPWAWTDKRGWSDEHWQAYVENPQCSTFVAYQEGSPAGYYELKEDPEGGVEIVYFGLMPAFIGRGWGGVLLTSALEQAWQLTPSRVWVHTCSLDHPVAIPNYQARGMKIFKEMRGER